MERINKYTGWDNLPRVTEILEIMGVIDTRFYTKKGADRGTDIHLLTELIDEGLLEYVDIQGNQYQDWLEGYFRFKNENEVVIEEIEREVIFEGEYAYKGHIDRIMVVNGERFIVDIKTGQVQKWNGLQLAAYGMAYNPDMSRAVLKLEKNGNYKFKTKISRDLSSEYWLREWSRILKEYYSKYYRKEG